MMSAAPETKAAIIARLQLARQKIASVRAAADDLSDQTPAGRERRMNADRALADAQLAIEQSRAELVTLFIESWETTP